MLQCKNIGQHLLKYSNKKLNCNSNDRYKPLIAYNKVLIPNLTQPFKITVHLFRNITQITISVPLADFGEHESGEDRVETGHQDEGRDETESVSNAAHFLLCGKVRKGNLWAAKFLENRRKVKFRHGARLEKRVMP